MEYGSCVWDPQCVALQQENEKVQNRAARFVTSNYCFETGRMTGILENLKWVSQEKEDRQQTDSFVQRLKEAASIPTDDLIPQIRCSRNHHSLTFQTPAARTDIYKGSFFPQSNRDWHVLPDSIITSTEGAEDDVARFTSLVELGTYFPYHSSW